MGVVNATGPREDGSSVRYINCLKLQEISKISVSRKYDINSSSRFVGSWSTRSYPYKLFRLLVFNYSSIIRRSIQRLIS